MRVTTRLLLPELGDPAACREPTPSGYTYFIQAGAGAVKIGQTVRTPAERLAALQTANPEPLRLIAYLVGVGYEAMFHRAYASQRLAGEWFTPSEPLAVGIACAILVQEQDGPIEALALRRPAYWAIVERWRAHLEPAAEEDAPHIWREAKRALAAAAEEHDAPHDHRHSLDYLGRFV